MRKLWNRPAIPVWSLVTTDETGQANMNICTYVTSVSLEPKLMLVAVYEGTKTLANLEASPRTPVLLQLLTTSLAPVVRVCGQQSGLKINKITRLKKRYDIAYHDRLPYFAAAAGYLILETESVSKVAGDHRLYTFSVLLHKNLSEESLLTTDILRANKLIR